MNPMCFRKYANYQVGSNNTFNPQLDEMVYSIATKRWKDICGKQSHPINRTEILNCHYSFWQTDLLSISQLAEVLRKSSVEESYVPPAICCLKLLKADGSSLELLRQRENQLVIHEGAHRKLYTYSSKMISQQQRRSTMLVIVCRV